MSDFWWGVAAGVVGTLVVTSLVGLYLQQLAFRSWWGP